MSTSMEMEKDAEPRPSLAPGGYNDTTRVPTPADNLSEKEMVKAGPSDSSQPEKVYLSGYKLASVYVGLLLSIFLIALDQTIVATAQPKIVSQFNALDKFAWVSTAYLLTQCGLMLMVGQILTITSSKLVFLASIGIFELGSLFCGVAPSIDFLIFGRAVAGVGAAGLFTSVLTMFAEVTRLEDRPVFFALFGATFGVSSVIGPLLGGAFSDHVSWRWCFYINLPFGGVTIATIIFFIHTPAGRTKKSVFGDIPLWQKWLKLDWIGSIIALGFVTCLILALQWGGNQKPWNSGSVIAPLVLAGVLFVTFFVWEYSIGDRAMLPTHLLRRRTQLWASIEGFFIFCTFLMGIFYLPLWYQAKGASASKAGVNILAFMLSVVITAAVCGGIVRRTGRYWYFMLLTPLLSSVASGLLFTIHPSTPGSRVVGFQILMGIGIGGALQQSILAVQTEYAREEHLIPQGTSVINFIRTLGGVIGITVGTTIFDNQLVKALPRFAPSLTMEQLMSVKSSVAAIFHLPPELQKPVIEAYSYSLNRVFLIGVPAAALASFTTLLIDNYNIHERSPTSMKKGGGGAAAAA